VGFYGDLCDFPITDMLAMITSRGKSGTLRLSTPIDMITIVFDRGNVCSVSSTEVNQHIGRLLIKHGYVSEQQVEQGLVLQALSAPRARIGEVLVDFGFVTQKQVAEMVSIQLKTSLFRMLIDANGTFTFTPSEPAELLLQTGLHGPIESVVLDALRLADEWLATHPLRQVIAIADQDVDPTALAGLTDSEREILTATLNGSTQLHALALELPISIAEFDRCVLRLCERNLIRVSPPFTTLDAA
jgi:Domain of unknown function (DUF4388)